MANVKIRILSASTGGDKDSVTITPRDLHGKDAEYLLRSLQLIYGDGILTSPSNTTISPKSKGGTKIQAGLYHFAKKRHVVSHTPSKGNQPRASLRASNFSDAIMSIHQDAKEHDVNRIDMGSICVNLIPACKGMNAITYSKNRKHHAKGIIDNLGKAFGHGQLVDHKGTLISPDSEDQLQEGQYFYTLVPEHIHALPPYATRRLETCERLYELVDKHKYLLIKAPPQCGKSTLLRLFQDWASKMHSEYKLVYIDLSTQKEGFQMDDVLNRALHCTFSETIAGENPVMLFIDEIQLAYLVEKTGSANFWEQLGTLTATHKIGVVMAASHGVWHNGSTASIPCDIPNPEMIVTVRPTSPGGASVQLRDGEWAEIWENFRGCTGLELGDHIKRHVGSICSQQPGLLIACLEYLKHQLVHTLKESYEDTNSSAWVVLTSKGFYDNLECMRSIMDYEKVEKIPGAVPLMQKLIWLDHLPAPQEEGSLEAEAISKLCEYGQLVLLERPRRLEFTSPLHKIAFVQRHFTGTCTTSQLLTILELLVKCVERMDTEILLHSECQGSGAKLLERAWQMELYRVLVMLLPWVVSPDVAKSLGGHGYVDFYISLPLGILLEVTREGLEVPEHLGRFLDPKKYGPLVNSEKVTEYAVVDFRCPNNDDLALEPDFAHEHLYTVVFLPDYKEAVIHHMHTKKTVKLMTGNKLTFKTEMLMAAIKAGNQAS